MADDKKVFRVSSALSRAIYRASMVKQQTQTSIMRSGVIMYLQTIDDREVRLLVEQDIAIVMAAEEEKAARYPHPVEPGTK